MMCFLPVIDETPFDGGLFYWEGRRQLLVGLAVLAPDE
jgi:hypothetical protein